MVRRPTAGGRVVTGVAPGLQNRWQALRSAVGSTPMRPRQETHIRTSPKNFGSRRLEQKNLLRLQLQEVFFVLASKQTSAPSLTVLQGEQQWKPPFPMLIPES